MVEYEGSTQIVGRYSDIRDLLVYELCQESWTITERALFTDQPWYGIEIATSAPLSESARAAIRRIFDETVLAWEWRAGFREVRFT